jgi:hypothetical protein
MGSFKQEFGGMDFDAKYRLLYNLGKISELVGDYNRSERYYKMAVYFALGENNLETSNSYKSDIM